MNIRLPELPMFQSMEIPTLTPRAYFALVAMQSLIIKMESRMIYTEIAKGAVEMADALTAELEKENEDESS
jgi:hypothetical protein